MPTLKLLLPDLREPEDERRLEQAYADVGGVYRAIASHGGHCVEIDFEDDEITPSRLIEIARGVGFEARLAG